MVPEAERRVGQEHSPHARHVEPAHVPILALCALPPGALEGRDHYPPRFRLELDSPAVPPLGAAALIAPAIVAAAIVASITSTLVTMAPAAPAVIASAIVASAIVASAIVSSAVVAAWRRQPRGWRGRGHRRAAGLWWPR
jgi:hypothetical protein